MALKTGLAGRIWVAMTKRNRGWRKIKTLTPEQTADARARMGLDEEGLRRSREQKG